MRLILKSLKPEKEWGGGGRKRKLREDRANEMRATAEQRRGKQAAIRVHRHQSTFIPAGGG